MHAKRFLVTGGSQGIGAAIVTLARRAGHEVVFTGRNEQLIEQVTRETGAHGVRADVSIGDDNARTLDACRVRMGGLDVTSITPRSGPLRRSARSTWRPCGCCSGQTSSGWWTSPIALSR